jgi:GNAT superfamily N-acetyltransferase
MAGRACTIIRIGPADMRPELLAQVEAIFWQTSARAYPPGPEREAFQERWLGRYLCTADDVVLIALDSPDVVAGYLVGALADPARQARFDDIGYFRTDFSPLTERFPAHLHINLDARFRSRGIGTQLVEVFAAHARRAGAPGMHVVTGKGMRNVRFYQRSGFAERGTAPWKGGEIVFLGREL